MFDFRVNVRKRDIKKDACLFANTGIFDGQNEDSLAPYIVVQT